jgi:methyltransferase (TIGR00027 family)
VDAERASRTAIGTAFARAVHCEYDRPRIFEDSLARHMLSEADWELQVQRTRERMLSVQPELAEAALTDVLLAALHSSEAASGVLTRARYTEDRLAEALGHRVSQYVILGAGFDSFALRRRDLESRLQVFEVDHPATQALKRERLAAAGLDLPANLHFGPADFEVDTLAAVLARLPFDGARPAFFSLLGVATYLTPEAVDETFRSVRALAAPGSELVFDYVENALFRPENQGEGVRYIFQNVRAQGEPFLSSFDPERLAGHMRSLDFELIEDQDSKQRWQRYFESAGAPYHALPLGHMARVAVE